MLFVTKIGSSASDWLARAKWGFWTPMCESKLLDYVAQVCTNASRMPKQQNGRRRVHEVSDQTNSA
jgi:hypothetical protein